MGSGSTTRLAIPYPVGTDPNNIPVDLQALAARLDLLDATLTGVETLANKTLSAPAINGGVLDAASTLGGVSGTSLAADRTAWTAYTPVLTAITLGNGTLTAAYKQVGKMVKVRFSLIFGTTTTIAGGAAFALPVNAVTAGPTQALPGIGWHTATGNAYSVGARANHGNGQTALLAAQGNVNATNPFAWAAGDELAITGEYEAA